MGKRGGIRLKSNDRDEERERRKRTRETRYRGVVVDGGIAMAIGKSEEDTQGDDHLKEGIWVW